MNWISDARIDHLRQISSLPDLSQTPYRLIRTLGSGGMATVYLAEDTKLSRQVALKVMEDLETTDDMASRMQAEARVTAQLEHPGIVPVHDVGTLPDGRVFYAMKYVQGNSLARFAHQPRSIPEKLRVFLKICEPIAFAHSRGVIHRDLKPENILIGSFGEVLVMDWGVAKSLTSGKTAFPAGATASPTGTNATAAALSSQSGNCSAANPQTASGTILGTPSYMAPEQALGLASWHDPLTDVYALGAILYFLLTGHHPFEGTSIPEIQQHFREGRTLRPRQLNQAIPRPLEAACVKAMSIAPENRYSSAERLAADLESFLNDLPVSAYRETVLEKAGRWIKRNRFIVWLLLAYIAIRFLLYFLARR